MKQRETAERKNERDGWRLKAQWIFCTKEHFSTSKNPQARRQTNANVNTNDCGPTITRRSVNKEYAHTYTTHTIPVGVLLSCRIAGPAVISRSPRVRRKTSRAGYQRQLPAMHTMWYITSQSSTRCPPLSRTLKDIAYKRDDSWRRLSPVVLLHLRATVACLWRDKVVPFSFPIRRPIF